MEEKLPIRKQKLKSVINITHLVTLFYRSVQKGFKDVVEFHDFWEIVYVDNGKITVHENDKSYTLGKGEMYLHRPNAVHYIECQSQNANIFIISFVCKSPLLYTFKKYDFVLNNLCIDILSKIMNELRNSPQNTQDGIYFDFFNSKNEPAKNDPSGTLQCIKIYIELLFITLFRMQYTGEEKVAVMISKDDFKDEVCNEIIDYIKDHLYKALSVNQLCKDLNIGKTMACTKFKTFTGKSIKNYYTEMKMNEAKRLLKNKKLNICEISELLHYSSPYYFSMAFKNYTGLSPSEYMNSIK